MLFFFNGQRVTFITTVFSLHAFFFSSLTTVVVLVLVYLFFSVAPYKLTDETGKHPFPPSPSSLLQDETPRNLVAHS